MIYKFNSILWGFLLLGNMLFAQNRKITINPKVGVFSQNFNWSIAGTENGTSPNILSELQWNKLRGQTYGLGIGYEWTPKINIEFNGQYSLTSRGKGNDSDYAENNRLSAFSDVDFESNEGHSAQFEVKAAYQIIQIRKFSLYALLNFQHSSDKFTGKGFSLAPDEIGILYQTYCNGGNGGVQLKYDYKSYFIHAQYELGLFDYKAKANWALNDKFQHPISFKHLALGVKHSSQIMLGYHLSPKITMYMEAQHNYAFTLPGLDIAYRANGNTERTQFNGSNLSKSSILLGIQYKVFTALSPSKNRFKF